MICGNPLHSLAMLQTIAVEIENLSALAAQGAEVKQALNDRISDRDTLERAIAAIPDETISTACVLFFVVGLSWAEVAEHIGGVSATGVASLVQKYLYQDGKSGDSDINTQLPARYPTPEERVKEMLGSDVFTACIERGAGSVFSLPADYIAICNRPVERSQELLSVTALAQKPIWKSECLTVERISAITKQWKTLLSVLIDLRPTHTKAQAWKTALAMLD